MRKKEKAVVPAFREFLVNPILAHQNSYSSHFEQENYVSFSRAGFRGGPRVAYLTYTDKSPSDRGKNSHDFQEYSMKLYLKTMELYRKDKKMLQTLHRRGLQKIKYINDNNIVLYSPSNPSGNSNAGWKLAQNMSDTDKARLASKQSAFEKALSNVDLWEYFATFTLDRTKQDRYDFKKALTHITKFLQYRHIKYFMVPERHKDGAWHFHALLSAEMGQHLSDFEGKALKNWYISSCLSQGKPIKHCKAYTDNFGYNTIEPCRDKERCTHYMTKYVLKTFDDPNFERVSRRRFFCSKGLKSPVIVMPSAVELDEFEISYCSHFTEKVYLVRVPSSFVIEKQAEAGDLRPGALSSALASSPNSPPASPVSTS